VLLTRFFGSSLGFLSSSGGFNKKWGLIAMKQTSQDDDLDNIWKQFLMIFRVGLFFRHIVFIERERWIISDGGSLLIIHDS